MGKDKPAQFTSDEGEGRDLYACHSKEAAFARLLYHILQHLYPTKGGDCTSLTDVPDLGK